MELTQLRSTLGLTLNELAALPASWVKRLLCVDEARRDYLRYVAEREAERAGKARQR